MSILIAPPKAGALIESLRGVGYNLSTALADILDNSISAAASNIDIIFVWNGEHSKIFIQDDGDGMTSGELRSAMMLGEKSPNDIRNPKDLGRFGLGLKTSSFSQCRRLTVMSCKNLQISSMYWDLDIIANDPDDRWILNLGTPEPLLSYLNQFSNPPKNGTLVCWEILDRVVTKNFQETNFLDLIDSVERHLSMVFHRFLDGTEGKINIQINGKRLAPWDPFMQGNISKPWHSGLARHPLAQDVVVECHVLPHHDRISDSDFEYYQGPDGWTAQQGFYVYRGARMLVAGSWLGLGKYKTWTKDESHRLARIRLDIPVDQDLDWKIDIKKATARPPVHLRDWLVHIAEITRGKARNVFAYRGERSATAGTSEIQSIWQCDSSTGGMKYSIDLHNPTVAAVVDSLGPEKKSVISLLKLIQETVPVQRIWLDTELDKDTPLNRFKSEPSDEVRAVLHDLFSVMTTLQGMTAEQARLSLSKTDPFQDYPELVNSLC